MEAEKVQGLAPDDPATAPALGVTSRPGAGLGSALACPLARLSDTG